MYSLKLRGQHLLTFVLLSTPWWTMSWHVFSVFFFLFFFSASFRLLLLRCLVLLFVCSFPFLIIWNWGCRFFSRGFLIPTKKNTQIASNIKNWRCSSLGCQSSENGTKTNHQWYHNNKNMKIILNIIIYAYCYIRDVSSSAWSRCWRFYVFCIRFFGLAFTIAIELWISMYI